MPAKRQAQIHFAGSLSREQVQEKLQTATLYLSTSSMETFGMALQEAKAFGLPILALKAGYTAPAC